MRFSVVSSSRFFDRRLLQQMRPERAGFVLTVALGTLGGAATVAQALALSEAVEGAFLRGLDLAGVRPWLVALAGFAAVRALTIWAGEVTANRVALRVKSALRHRLMAHILSLGPAYTRGERTGELVNTAVEGVDALDAYFSQYLPQLALAAVVPFTLAAFILPRDLLSCLVLLLTAPLIPLFMVLIGSLADALTRRQWMLLSRMSAHFLDILQGLTTLKLFNRSREQIAVIRQITDRHRDATLQVLRVAFLSALVLEMVGTLSTAIVAVEIGLRLLYGKMIFRDAFFVLVLAPEFYLPLRQLGTRFHAGIAGIAAARRIFEVLDTRPPETAAVSGRASFAASPQPRTAVSFRDVHYTYPGRETPALKGVSFDIGPSEKVALVGPTGAGKSTAAQLLLGFIHPTAGTVIVAPPPGPQAGLTIPVAWVPQSPYLFHATVVENIRLGRPNAPLAAVVHAAEAAGADVFIRALPQGYDTVIGERGTRLSGGEAQRIALARAFLVDAPLVIMDEPTANLDLETEAAVQAGSERLLVGRSALIIAHRLHTARAADRILVMEEGRVVESGTHQELLMLRGAYWRLVAALEATVAGSPGQPDPDTAPQPTETQLPSHTPTDAARRVQHTPRRTLLRLLSFLAPSGQWVALAVLLGFLTVGSSIGLMAASAWIVATAALQPSIAVLQVAIVGVRFFGIARGVLRYLERLVSHQVTFRLLAELRVWFYSAIEPLAPARLAGQRSGDLLSRIVSDIGALEQFYIRVVAPPLVALLVAVLAVLLFGSHHLSLIWPLLTFLLLAGLAAPLLAQRLARAVGPQLALSRAELSVALVDGIQGAADLIAFGAAEGHVQRVARHDRALAACQARAAAITGVSAALGALLAWLAVVSVMATAVPLAAAGVLPGVRLAVLALATLASFEAVLPLPGAAQALVTSLAAAHRLFDLVGHPPRAGTPTGARACADGPALKVRGLTVRYASGEPPALDGISFEAPPGSRIAVVGASGAGKSTLAGALLRFYDYEDGEVRLCGQDLRSLDPEVVRQQFGVVTQQTHLFYATVRENLLLARPGATQPELEEVTRAAQIHHVIEALPQGYDTWIGEQGMQLSGGERQRLAVARALLKDAALLILDEPTANLDAATARALFHALAPLTAGKTTLIITHDLERLQSADLILVLERGRLVEQGTHARLMAHDGVYRRLWQRQWDMLGPP